MGFLEEAIGKIEAQQPKERTTVWVCGEQLKDILRAEPELAEIVLKDLENKAMSLTECEKKFKARADEKHRSDRGNRVCVLPMEAEEIIRKFYGLPEKSSEISVQRSEKAEVIELADFF